MIFPCTALYHAKRDLIGLLLAPARVGTELVGQLVGASMRTTCAIWAQLVNVPTRSETPDRERTAEGRPGAPGSPADSAQPDRWSRSDVNRTTESEARPISALERPSSPDLVSTEPVSTEAVSTEPVPTDLVPTDVVPPDQLTVDQPSPEPSLARTPPGAGAMSGTVDVTFRVPATVGAHSAHVCGEFNDWSTTADPMDRRDDGSFELTRALLVGRRWRFRYLLDGDRWENDWTADDYPPNAFGDHDSVVDLRTPSTSRLVSGHRLPDE